MNRLKRLGISIGFSSLIFGLNYWVYHHDLMPTLVLAFMLFGVLLMYWQIWRKKRGWLPEV